MRRLILLLPIFLIACDEPLTEYIYVSPDIPQATLTPCERQPRDISTPRNLAVAYVEAVQSDDCNRGKVIAIATILAAEVNPEP
jgi:hypothetical protein